MKPTLTCLLAAASALALSAQPSYQFTDLGTPGEHFYRLSAQINNRGTLGIAASEPIPDEEDPFLFNPERGFFHRDGHYIEIVHPYEPPEPDLRGPGYIVSDINDFDLGVGHFISGPDSTMSYLFDVQTLTFTELELGGVWVYDFANNGYLLGGSLANTDLPVIYHVFTHEQIWLHEELEGDPYTVLIQMNNFALVHGEEIDPLDREFLYQTGAADPLTFGEFDGVLTDLGTFVNVPAGALPGPIVGNPFHEHGRLNANDWGVIVGASQAPTPRAFVYDGTDVHDLNTLVPAAVAANWTLEHATDINDLGQIVGSMRNAAGDVHLFLMSPSDIAVSDGEWDALGFANQDGTFTITYDAVPMAANLDGVTGLSLTPAEAYTDLAAIVRFNTNGRVDARNGNYYRSVNALEYLPGVPHRIELTVDLATRRYSATVTPAGGSPVVIADNYRFRTEMGGATHLDTLNVLSVDGAVSVGNVHLDVPSSGIPTLESSGGQWAQAELPDQAGTFTLRFKATPSLKPVDGSIGFSLGPADALGDLAANIRFNTSSRVDVRHGNRYGASRVFTYQAGQTYDVIMTVNVAAHTYSVKIGATGTTPVTIASNYPFRQSQAGVPRLDTLNVHNTRGTLTVTDAELE